MVRDLYARDGLRSLRWVAALVIAHGVSSPRIGYAQAEAPLAAREHFDKGVDAARRGELSTALEHFEHANARSPNQTVLYNLAQTYSALSRPVEAIQSLRLYLERDAPPSDMNRRREVEQLLRLNERRVGRLVLQIEPRDAAIEIDGVPAKTEVPGGVIIGTGRHVVVGLRDGYQPGILRVDVRAGETVKTRLELGKTSRTGGLLELSCDIPDVVMSVDDVVVSRSPQTPLVAITSGEHRVRFVRPGYSTSEFSISTKASAIARAECQLKVDANLSRSNGAELRVVTSDLNARVLVDGAPFRGGLLPAGNHLVRVEQRGFESWQRKVDLEAGKRALILANPLPSAETRLARRARTRRTWAYVAGGTGVGLGALATTLLLSNHQRYQDWRRDHDALSQELSEGRTSADQSRRASNLQHGAASIQRTDDLAIGSAVLGGLLLAVSASLILGDDQGATGEAAATSPTNR